MQGNNPLIPNPDFDRLIPKARWTDESVKRNAKLEDTLQFLPKGVARCKWQVAKIISLLKGETLDETCYNIWYRLYTGVRYEKDEDGKEQIRSPRRTWWGHKGDCDDFSVFVSCILSNLNIKHLFRIAMYKEGEGYQHIYPVAIAPDGTEIIIDCVLPKFNREVSYIKKIDKEMELQFLDGIGDEAYQNINGIDAEDLLQGNLGELGKRFRDTKFFKGLKKGLHSINRFNPVTTLLRTGVLLCMKLNLLKVAGDLRYTYLSDAQAKQKGFDMNRFAKLKNVRDKLEKIFYGAGGKEENLKKAILTGRGNRNKEVPLGGLGSVDMEDYNTSHSTAQILGADIYNSELAGLDEYGSLGIDPGTDTAVATAMTALTALAAIIKSIGGLKPKGGSDTSDTTSPDASGTTATDGSGNAGSTTATTDTSTKATTPTDGGANTDTPATATGTASGDGSQNAGSNSRAAAANTGADTANTGDASNNADGNTAPATTNSTTPDATQKPTPTKTGFKEWVKANKVIVGISGAVLLSAISFGAYKLATRKKKTNSESNSAGTQTVSGVPKRKKKRGNMQKLGKIKFQKLR